MERKEGNATFHNFGVQPDKKDAIYLTATLTSQFTQTRPSTDNNYSFDSGDDIRSGCRTPVTTTQCTTVLLRTTLTTTVELHDHMLPSGSTNLLYFKLLLVFPRISAHALISTLSRKSAHPLGHKVKPTPPPSSLTFLSSRNTRKTCFYQVSIVYLLRIFVISIRVRDNEAIKRSSCTNGKPP